MVEWDGFVWGVQREDGIGQVRTGLGLVEVEMTQFTELGGGKEGGEREPVRHGWQWADSAAGNHYIHILFERELT